MALLFDPHPLKNAVGQTRNARICQAIGRKKAPNLSFSNRRPIAVQHSGYLLTGIFQACSRLECWDMNVHINLIFQLPGISRRKAFLIHLQLQSFLLKTQLDQRYDIIRFIQAPTPDKIFQIKFLILPAASQESLGSDCE